MPLNPMIPLQAKTPDMNRIFSDSLMNLQRVSQMKEQQATMPFKLDALRQRQGINEQQSQINQQTIDNGDQSVRVRKLSELYSALQTGDRLPVERYLSELAQTDAEGAAELKRLYDNPDNHKQLAGILKGRIEAIQAGSLQDGQKNVANSKMFPNGTSVSIRRDGSKVVSDASGNILTGQAAIDAVNAGIQSDVALSGGKAGAGAQSKANVDLVMEPQVAGAVGEVSNEVSMKLEKKKQTFAEKKTQKINDKTFKTYESAIANVANTLGLTPTGYFSGLLPAVSDSQRTADGAKSIILPILKSMFRESGEGVFTDKDQEVLEGMIPTRQDNPEVTKVKLEMLDQVVRSKLNQSLSTPDSLSQEDKAILDKYGVTPE